ncbi:hypothetical protein MCA1773 [Methylococcus capsulatus str. Bath]|uniref:Uncharacterized protein n=1 Tax=Methylococcus capsulatus (strain ATCC 33009 / NCIMB 11132 / Bath) TaxID=243233 RepID=Q607I7_METCA|nr:hypothetical protein MCA1773 [Methylococcus capsulatus str. Bath]
MARFFTPFGTAGSGVRIGITTPVYSATNPAQ